MYEILIERAAEKDLRRLDHHTHDRVIEKIIGLGEDPRPVGAKKLSGSEHNWRIRVGDGCKTKKLRGSCGPTTCFSLLLFEDGDAGTPRAVEVRAFDQTA